MNIVLHTFLICWTLWAMINLSIALFLPSKMIVPGAYVTGLWRNQRIVIDKNLDDLLTTAELQAIIAHENGHIANNHLGENLLVAILIPFVLPFREERRQAQELEADDWAVTNINRLGYAASALSSAIRKLSKHPFDLYRAQRLDDMFIDNGRLRFDRG